MLSSTPKQSLEELLEGFDIADIAKYINKKTNSANATSISDDASELAGYQPYRSGDTQPDTSSKGQSTGNATALIYATGNAKAGKNPQNLERWDRPYIRAVPEMGSP